MNSFVFGVQKQNVRAKMLSDTNASRLESGHSPWKVCLWWFQSRDSPFLSTLWHRSDNFCPGKPQKHNHMMLLLLKNTSLATLKHTNKKLYVRIVDWSHWEFEWGKRHLQEISEARSTIFLTGKYVRMYC